MPRILFDLDGTLLPDNIYPPQRRAMLSAIRTSYGIDPDAYTVDWVGRTDRGLFYEYHQFGFGDIAVAMQVYADFFVANLGEVKPREGAAAMLEELKAKGFDCVIVSGNMRQVGTAKLESAGLAEYFDLDTSGWGDEAIFREQVVPDALPGDFLVGDTWRDIAAAQQFQVPAIGLVTPKHDEVELEDADYIVYSLSELTSVLTQEVFNES